MSCFGHRRDCHYIASHNSCKALPILPAIEKMVDDLVDTHLVSDTSTSFLTPTGPSACTVKDYEVTVFLCWRGLLKSDTLIYIIHNSTLIIKSKPFKDSTADPYFFATQRKWSTETCICICSSKHAGHSFLQCQITHQNKILTGKGAGVYSILC